MEELEYRMYLKNLLKTVKSTEVKSILKKLKEDRLVVKMNSTTIKEYKRTIKLLAKRLRTKRTFLRQAESSGEKKIKRYLINSGIPFKQECEFPDLYNPDTKCKLRFDFYLPSLNLAIEFDGQQHFTYVEEFDKGDRNQLVLRQYRDELKNKYCLDRKIKLLRISYKDYFKIEQILNKELKEIR